MKKCNCHKCNNKQRNSLGLVEKDLNNVVSAFRMVKEYKEGPVYEPGPLLQGLERRAHRLKGKSTQSVKLNKSSIKNYSNVNCCFFTTDKASCCSSCMRT